MKKIMILTTTMMICFGTILKAQTKNDSVAIEKACRDYVEGWATGDIDRVAKGVSPELVKLTVGKDKEGVCFTNNMSASLLLLVTKMNKKGVMGKDLEPDKAFKLDVHIYDVTPDFALVKTVNTKYGFFDYCELAKFNGEWRIFNVLWGWLPEK